MDYKQMLRFLVAGIAITSIDFTVYFLLLKVLPMSIAKAISFCVAGIVGYLLNKYWTFEQNHSSSSEVGRYWIINLAALGLNVLMNYQILQMWPNRVLLALCIATASTSIFIYVGLKWWVFRA